MRISAVTRGHAPRQAGCGSTLEAGPNEHSANSSSAKARGRSPNTKSRSWRGPSAIDRLGVLKQSERKAELISRLKTLRILNQVVADQTDLLRRLMGEGIELSMSSASGLGAVMADPSQIQQVLMNLAVNSRDAMPSGGRLTIDNLRRGLARNRRHRNVSRGWRRPLPGPDSVRHWRRDERRCAGPGARPFFTTKPPGQGTGL